jgi:hypothetical protein
MGGITYIMSSRYIMSIFMCNEHKYWLMLTVDFITSQIIFGHLPTAMVFASKLLKYLTEDSNRYIPHSAIFKSIAHIQP